MQVNNICYIVKKFQICQADLAWNSSQDSLTIYDGGSKSFAQIGKFCGNSLPPNKIISSSHQLLLHFKTNIHGTFPGFQIGYNTISKFYKSISFYAKIKVVLILNWRLFTWIVDWWWVLWWWDKYPRMQLWWRGLLWIMYCKKSLLRMCMSPAWCWWTKYYKSISWRWVLQWWDQQS